MKITIMICLMMIPLDGTVLATRTFMDKSNLLLIEICFQNKLFLIYLVIQLWSFQNQQDSLQEKRSLSKQVGVTGPICATTSNIPQIQKVRDNTHSQNRKIANQVRNVLLRSKFRVSKNIIFFTGGPNFGCANGHPCALGSASPGT